MNFSKSSRISRNGVIQNYRDEILITLDMREVLSYEKYLGLPTHIGGSKRKDFTFFKDRVVKKIKGWLRRTLSCVGREVLAKVLAQAILTL